MSNTCIFIKGAIVISVETDGKPIYNCDILIENEWIMAVGPNLSTPSDRGVVLIDAKNCIVTPGFVDGHHHMWQHLLRGITIDWSLFGYACHLRSVYGSLYTPEDVYFANYAAALSLLGNGVTTVLDHCHVINSPAHADAAVKGLRDAAIRGTFCYGLYQNPQKPGDFASVTEDAFDPPARAEDARRVREAHFSDNDPRSSLLTFGIAINDPPTIPREQSITELQLARDLGARLITVHASVACKGEPRPEIVQTFVDENMMGPDLVFSHGGWMTDNELGAVQRSAAGIVGTPDTELQMGMGYPVVWKAADLGCRRCLGLDITSNQGNDFMAQMRLTLQTQRARDYDYTVQTQLPRKTASALRMATLGGAEVMHLESLIGSIEPGKKADLVMFRCDDIDTVPVLDPIGTVVFHVSPKNIDTVIVDGKILKRGGQLVGVEWDVLREQIITRSQRLTEQAAAVDMEKAETLFQSIFEKALQD